MVMMIEPLQACLSAARADSELPARVIYLTPQGAPLTQRKVRELAALPRLVLLCGRYEGVDERLVAAEVDEEISIGDYVLSGGELAAAVVIDAVARLQEGALNDAESAAQDSFEADGLLDCPHFTHPASHALGEVPAVLRSGDHAAIARWRRQQALGRTWLRRPELLDEASLSKADRALLEAFRRDPLPPSGEWGTGRLGKGQKRLCGFGEGATAGAFGLRRTLTPTPLPAGEGQSQLTLCPADKFWVRIRGSPVGIRLAEPTIISCSTIR
jgi:tRNA (guanine37-N1)-methyltransferase